MRRGFEILICLLLIANPYSLAQTYKSSITGVVSDPTGALLPGVTVTAVNQQTNIVRSATTDERGDFTLVELSPGVYRLEAELPGFKKFIQSEIILQIEQVARIPIQMELGVISDSVEVIAEPPLINTESAARGEVVTHEEISDLPLIGRDFADLAYLSVGVTPRAQDGQGSAFSINGARADGVSFIVDSGANQNIRGGGAQVRPSLDSIQEFRVQTGNYSAEYGRLSSGVINMALRSGTNKFHGSLYEFHRNDFFDARNFFDQGQKSKLIRHNFGANLAGPIRRNKAFFFVNYEGMREREGAPRLGRVPTLKERQGDFSESAGRDGAPIHLVDPVTKEGFPNNIIPQSRFAPVSVRLLEYYPLPNRAGRLNLDTRRLVENYYSNKLDHDAFNDWVVKFDYHFTKGDSVSLRYLLNNRFEVAPFGGSILPGFGNEADTGQHMWGVNYTRVIRPKLLNQTLLSFSRSKRSEHSRNWQTDHAKALGISGLTENPRLFGFPRITVRGYADLGDDVAMPLDFTVNNYQFNNITSIIRGRHNIRAGAEIVRTQFFQLFANNARGVFSFQGRWTSGVIGPDGRFLREEADPLRQEPFADFLLGFLQSSNRRINDNTSYMFSTTYGFYLQDDWKIRRNVTVNLGVRYELLIPPCEKFGRWANFVPEAERLVTSGDKDFPKSLIYTDKNNIAPRLGFAWRPLGKNRTVIRAGWGLFYSMNLQNPLRSQLGTNPPFTIRENFSRQTSNPLLLTFSSPFPDRRLVIDSINAPNGFQIDAATGQLQQYNLTFEQQLTGNLALEVAYVGSKGTHLGRQYDVNQPIRAADIPLPFPRRFPGFTAIDYFAFDADSNYNAFQMSLRKRSSRALNFRVNYSLSKSIDDASQLSGRSAAGFTGVQDTLNRDAEHGLSDFDRRHVVVGSVIYYLPFARAGRTDVPAWLRTVAGGWQISSIARLMSGTPITPQLASFDFNLGEAKRPDRLGSGRLPDPTPERWFSIADFQPVPRGGFRYGNSGRNIVPGPAHHYLDIALMKLFYLPSEDKVELRWGVYNVPNFTNFLLPEENIDVASAGRITRAQAGRRMQFSLKYIF